MIHTFGVAYGVAVELVVGVDAGGTSTRCLVADAAGRVLGTGEAAGLNQRSSGGDPVDRLVQAVGEALDGHDPASVMAGVLGVAGAGAAGVEVVRAHGADAWRRLGMRGEPVVVTDLVTAFAAGTPAPSGTVLVAGTGAGAAAIADRQVVRQADAAGWLLGDVGSAVWLAREALVAAVADLDGRGPSTALTDPLLGRLLDRPPPYDVQDVIARAYAVPPASLGTLAPVVTGHAGDDPVAREIVAGGVAGLLASLDAVRPEGSRVPEHAPERVLGHTPQPVVLAGALLTSDGPVRDGVVHGLARRGVAEPGVARRPAAGAAWLALVSRGVAEEKVHSTLTAG